MEKTLKILASLFWIIGLAASIIGLNIKTDTGRWISVAGNITFDHFYSKTMNSFFR